MLFSRTFPLPSKYSLTCHPPGRHLCALCCVYITLLEVLGINCRLQPLGYLVTHCHMACPHFAYLNLYVKNINKDKRVLDLPCKHWVENLTSVIMQCEPNPQAGEATPKPASYPVLGVAPDARTSPHWEAGYSSESRKRDCFPIRMHIS